MRTNQNNNEPSALSNDISDFWPIVIIFTKLVVNVISYSGTAVYQKVKDFLGVEATLVQYELEKAIIRGDLGAVKKCIEQGGASCNQAHSFSHKPLVIAICNQQYDIMRYLIEKGAMLDEPFQQHLLSRLLSELIPNRIPLIAAIATGNRDIVKLLLQCGANVNQAVSCREQPTPLIAAIATENRDVVKLLLQHGANVNQAVPYLAQPTPLIAAIASQNIQMVQLLIHHKANLNPNTYYLDGLRKRPLLSFAVEHCIIIKNKMWRFDSSILDYLLGQGLDICNHSGEPPIEQIPGSFVHYNLQVLRYLMDHGAPLTHTVISRLLRPRYNLLCYNKSSEFELKCYEETRTEFKRIENFLINALKRHQVAKINWINCLHSIGSRMENSMSGFFTVNFARQIHLHLQTQEIENQLLVLVPAVFQCSLITALSHKAMSDEILAMILAMAIGSEHYSQGLDLDTGENLKYNLLGENLKYNLCRCFHAENKLELKSSTRPMSHVAFFEYTEHRAYKRLQQQRALKIEHQHPRPNVTFSTV